MHPDEEGGQHEDPRPVPNEHGMIGQTVLYRLSKEDADHIGLRRRDSVGQKNGNSVREGEVVPMIVVTAWSADCVNGQIILDGNDSLWATSVERGDQPGQWDFR